MYNTPDGYKGYKHKILDYTFDVFETPDGYYSFGAPFGDTPKEKAMFDKLVYHNKSLYQGKDKEKIIKDIENFITNNQ